MNDKFMDEYDTELVNKTLMASMKDEGYTNGLNEGKQIRNIEIAKNLLQANVNIDIISESTGLTKEEIESLN